MAADGEAEYALSIKESLSPRQQDQMELQGKQRVKKNKSQDPSHEFVNILSERIEEIEKSITSGNQSEREGAKLRKKQLRDTQKYVLDKNNSVEDRIQFIQTKFVAQASELTKVEKQLYETQKELDLMTKERDKVQSELKRTNLLKDKLEELCRQLQKEVREVAEEARKRNEEEVAQRQALQLRFQDAIQDVNLKMDQQEAERERQRAENLSLREKLAAFLAQIDLKEKHFESQLHAKDLEVQLEVARQEQASAQTQQLQAHVKLLEQKNDALIQQYDNVKSEALEMKELREQNALLATTNRDLKEQLEHYCEKFTEFQSALTKSNQMFEKLRGELDSHHKVRASLAKERDDAATRAVRNEALAVAATKEKMMMGKKVEKLQQEKTEEGEELRKLRLQKQRLEGLCRTLMAQVKGQNTNETQPAAQPAGSDPASGTSDHRSENEDNQGVADKQLQEAANGISTERNESNGNGTVDGVASGTSGSDRLGGQEKSDAAASEGSFGVGGAAENGETVETPTKRNSSTALDDDADCADEGTRSPIARLGSPSADDASTRVKTTPKSHSVQLDEVLSDYDQSSPSAVNLPENLF